MKVFFLLFATALSVEAFTSHFGSVRRHAFQQSASSSVLFSAETAAGVPPSTATPDSNVEDVTIPTNLPSDVGMDYIPLATMLATGQLAEADQVSFHRGVVFGTFIVLYVPVNLQFLVATVVAEKSI
uniref:Uncharacterized protein n=1 Tax=Corethron hystrix TaxID=216773 RepID=A0A6U5LK51_9STRA|mmetsp:Transcript_5928/g.12567  ORF Transcript_5928/g.12567 Transcript_5928/m.12567 type:complete len:127 (+) Transcript_5928:105-485(+)